MKFKIFTLAFCFSMAAGSVLAQKFTINFTPASLRVNEDVDTIHITATISPAPTTPQGIDIALDAPNGDWNKPIVTTLDFEPGHTVAYLRFPIVDNKNGKNIRVHHFGLDDFTHSFIKGTDSIFTLTIVDNDSTEDAGINPSLANRAAVNLYPNPAKGLLNISLPSGITGKIKISLMDMAGRLLKIYEPTYNTGGTITILLPEMPRGLNLVKIESSTAIINKQIMIE